MRITFLLPPVDLSGGIRVVAIYAEMLASRGHKVSLVSVPPKQPTLVRNIKNIIKGRSWQTVLPSPSHLDNFANHRILERFRPIVATDLPDADIVIATWWETAEWMAALPANKGRKVHFIQHYETFPWLPIERCLAVYNQPFAKIVVARWLKDTLQARHNQPSIVVPNAVDHSQFFAPARSKNQRPTLGFLYSKTPFKGADIALAVIERIREHLPNLRVVSFGATEFSHPGIEFHHSPPQDSIRNIYAACDVWLSTSTTEGFNLPSMEAMACRTPVVSTRTGWPAEAIDATNGALAEVNDVDGIVNGALSILNSENWQTLSEGAYRTVESYTWANSTDQFEAALCGMI